MSSTSWISEYLAIGPSGIGLAFVFFFLFFSLPILFILCRNQEKSDRIREGATRSQVFIRPLIGGGSFLALLSCDQSNPCCLYIRGKWWSLTFFFTSSLAFECFALSLSFSSHSARPPIFPSLRYSSRISVSSKDDGKQSGSWRFRDNTASQGASQRRTLVEN